MHTPSLPASLLALLLAAAPAAAWEFTAQPVCTLRHAQGGAEVALTYDPRLPEPYAITVTRPEPWPEAPSFAIRYGGARPLVITTDRHRRSPDGRSLTVTDEGFGNVLDGLEFNDSATALSGAEALPLDLTGAAPEVRRFRACAEAPLA